MAALQSSHAESSAEVTIAGLQAIGSLASEIKANITRLKKLKACAGSCLFHIIYAAVPLGCLPN